MMAFLGAKPYRDAKHFRALFLLVLGLTFLTGLWGQANPFERGFAPPPHPQAPTTAPVTPLHHQQSAQNRVAEQNRVVTVPFYVIWFSKVIQLQQTFQFGLSHAIRDLKIHPWAPALWTLLIFSFLYGALHVLLPGHQKSVIGAYFLSENARYGQGFLVGILFALAHGVSVTITLLVLRFVLRLAVGTSLAVATQFLQGFAVIGVVSVASVLVVRRLSQWKEVSRLSALDKMRQTLGFDWHDRLETSYEPVPWRRLLPFLFFAAVLPCPGSLLVLLFALGLGAPVLGLISVGAISLGMAVSLTLLSLAVIAVKKSGRQRVRSGRGRITVLVLELASLAALLGFSLLMWPAGPG
ncbi:MAG: hypothetical protein HKM05_09745 [Spirochaetales bacterium]|nr:hypothetical protein [Spirochaetales bacterium]